MQFHFECRVVGAGPIKLGVFVVHGDRVSHACLSNEYKFTTQTGRCGPHEIRQLVSCEYTHRCRRVKVSIGETEEKTAVGGRGPGIPDRPTRLEIVVPRLAGFSR